MQHQKGTALCGVIQEGKGTVVDEAPKTAFEALNCTLRDLTGNTQPMGGMCMLLCGTLDRSYQSFGVALDVILTLALKSLSFGTT